MAIKNLTIPDNFRLLEMSSSDPNRDFTEFKRRVEYLVNGYACPSRLTFETIFKEGCNEIKKVKCWRIELLTPVTFKFTVKCVDATIDKETYKYYYLSEEEANSLLLELNSINISEEKQDKGHLRYMADSSACDKNFSYGYEALLDYQLSWICRYACYAEKVSEEPTILKRQCDHILNVLVNGKYNPQKPIKPQKVFVYKQWTPVLNKDTREMIKKLKEQNKNITNYKNRIDLIIELDTADNNRYVILVESKAFTKLGPNQLLIYPVLTKDFYDKKNDYGEGNYIFLQRVVTIQEDETILNNAIKECRPKPEWDWKVLCRENLILKDKNGNCLRTGNPLFDEFWYTSWKAVDPACY